MITTATPPIQYEQWYGFATITTTCGKKYLLMGKSDGNTGDVKQVLIKSN